MRGQLIQLIMERGVAILLHKITELHSYSSEIRGIESQQQLSSTPSTNPSFVLPIADWFLSIRSVIPMPCSDFFLYMKIPFLPQAKQYWIKSNSLGHWVGSRYWLIILIFVSKLNNCRFLKIKPSLQTSPIRKVSAPSCSITPVTCLTLLQSSLIILSPPYYGFIPFNTCKIVWLYPLDSVINFLQ